MWGFILFILGINSIYGSIQIGPDVDETVTCVSYLLCNYTSGGGDPIIKWYKGTSIAGGEHIITYDSSGIKYEPGFTRHDIVDQATLQISDSILSDSDTYWCELTGLGVPFDDDSLILKVEEITSDVSLFISDEIVIESTSGMSTVVNMTCTISTTYDVEYDWELDGNHIDLTDERYFSNENGNVISIRNITRYDTGNYVCIVSRCDFTVKAEEEYLNVTYPPEIMKITHSCNSGDTICEADANPPPVYDIITDGNTVTCCAENSIGTDCSEVVDECGCCSSWEIALIICAIIIALLLITALVIWFVPLPPCKAAKGKLTGLCLKGNHT
ncbi:cell adhesion molecule CEACAM5-like [Glandiceps talaboti]